MRQKSENQDAQLAFLQQKKQMKGSVVMKSIIIFGWTAILFACWGWSRSVSAAEILVPAHHDTISSAVAAANTGDTIRITNSATYIERLLINKNITLLADPGQSPVIRANGLVNYVIRTTAGAAGAQIGSNAGGRIIIDADSNPAVSYSLQAVHGATPGNVTWENLLVRNPREGGGGFYPAACESTLNDIEFNGGGLMHLMIDHRPAGGFPLHLNRVYLHSMTSSLGGGFGIYSNAVDGDINISQCIFETHRETILFEDTGPAKFKVTIDRSLLSSRINSNNDVIDIRSSTDFEITNSVILAKGNGGRCIRLLPANNATVRIDHCDLIGDASVSSYANGGGILAYEGEGRTIEVTNSNIITPQLGVVLLVATGGETYLSDYNNIVTAGTRYGEMPPGANDFASPGVTPLYTAAATYNFTYTNPELVAAGAEGTSIGVNCDFTNLPFQQNPCPGGELPSAVHSTWGLY